MSHDKANDEGVPWHAVNDERDAVAPSKPAFPTTGATPVVPQEVTADHGEIIAPVAQPDAEEILPTSPQTWDLDEADGSTADAGAADPVRELGDSAVRQASLAASGATPRVAPATAGEQDTTRAFQPEEGVAPRPAWFAGDPRDNAPVSAAAWAASSAAYEPAAAPASPADADPTPPSAEAPQDEAPLEGPAATDADAADDADPGHDGDGTVPPPPVGERGDDGHDGRTPWYRGAVFLTVVGLVILAALAFVAYLTFFPAEDDVEVAAPKVVEVVAEPTIAPVALDDPTEFLAAMPATVGAYAMTAAAPVEEDAAGLSTRVAEVDDLTYSDGSTSLELRAIQHYDEDDATAQFDALAEGGADAQPVTVGGEEVGQRVTLDGDPATYVWRNGTAVFTLTGPADALDGFWIQFPL